MYIYNLAFNAFRYCIFELYMKAFHILFACKNISFRGNSP